LTAEGVELFDRNDDIFDKKWEYWIMQWCRWILSIPKSVNPSNDRTGEFSYLYQKDPVFNLGGGVTGPAAKYWRLGKDLVTRRIYAPKNNAILVPVSMGIESTAEFPSLFSNEQSLAEQAIKPYTESVKVTNMQARIDGVDITEEQLKKYYVLTEPFDVVYTENNIFDAPAGPSLAVSDGYWIFVKPTSKENFKIEFSQRTEENRLLGYYAFEYEVKYDVWTR
jgi:hypothetical protein